MTARQEILEVARDLTARGQTPFAPRDILAELHRRGTKYPDSTLQTHIVSAMCVNAPANHAITYPDLRRVGHGQYELTTEAGAPGHKST